MTSERHTARPSSRKLTALVTLCFLVTGITALVCETVWGRFLQVFTGSTMLAHTVVLACFMGGIALGNRLFGRLADRARDRIRLYGLLELGVGAYAVLFPQIIDGLGWAYTHAVLAVGPSPAARLVLKVVLALVALLPPTLLIGGTLPVLARALVVRLRNVGPYVAKLYFLNSLGAVLGALLAGFYLIEAFGLDLAVMLPGIVNIAIGSTLLLATRRRSRPENTKEAPEPAPEREPVSSAEPETAPDADRRRARLAFWCIAATGAVSFLFELVWFRLLGIAFGSTSQSFSVMLATFIAGITLGSYLAGRVLRSRQNALLAFALAELGLFVSMLLVLPLYERLPYHLAIVRSLLAPEPAAFHVYQASKVLLAAAILIVPTTFIGMTLPLATAAVVRSLPRLGSEVGAVFSANTAGAVVGATVTGLLFIPTLGAQTTLVLGIAATGLVGVVLLLGHAGLRRSLVAVCAPAWVAGVLVGVWLTGSWDARVMHAGTFRRGMARAVSTESFAAFRRSLTRDRKVLFESSDAEVSVAVIQIGSHDRALYINGKPDASTGPVDMPQQLLFGHLGVLLHPREQTTYQVLVVGFGSGGTAGAAVTHPGVHVDQVEISSAVMAAAKYFREVHDNVTAHKRFRLHLMDVREYLRTHPEKRYDLILAEPSNPWCAGEADLFSRQQFALYRKRLKPDGLVLQWVQSYEFNRAMLTRVFRTFHKHFPHASLWHSTESDLVLVGSRRSLRPDERLMRRRLRHPAVQRSLAKLRWPVDMTNPLFLLSRQLLSEQGFAARFPAKGPLLSERFPWLEFEAARALFVGASPQRFLSSLDERLVDGRGLLLGKHVARHGLRTTDLWELARAFHATRSLSGPRLRRAALYALHQRSPRDTAVRSLLLQDDKSGFSDYLLLGAALRRSDSLAPGLCRFAARTLQTLRKESTAMFYRPPEQLTAELKRRCVNAPRRPRTRATAP